MRQAQGGSWRGSRPEHNDYSTLDSYFYLDRFIIVLKQPAALERLNARKWVVRRCAYGSVGRWVGRHLPFSITVMCSVSSGFRFGLAWLELRWIGLGWVGLGSVGLVGEWMGRLELGS